jgi:hypothetical protein
MLKEKTLKYLGVENPKTLAEIYVEIAGLENIVKQAEEQITRWKQSIAVYKLQLSEQTDGLQEKSGTEEANS